MAEIIYYMLLYYLLSLAMASGDLDTIILQATQRLGYPSLRENQH